jgi:hypothetical protein
MAAQAITVAQGSMVAQASGLAPWLADRPTLDAAQSVADIAVATRVEAQDGVRFAGADTDRLHPDSLLNGWHSALPAVRFSHRAFGSIIILINIRVRPTNCLA